MGAKRNIAKKASPRWSRPAWLTGRRMVVGALFLFLVSGVGAGVWMLAQPDTLPIQRVAVKGEFRYLDREELNAAIGGFASGGFFNVNVRAVKEAAEALEWVDSASVRRVWPDTLQVEIQEQVPLAHWGEEHLLNQRGEMFAPSQPPANLPHLEGPEGSAPLAASRYLWLSGLLAPLHLHVAELRQSDRRAWDVRLDNGLHLLLGRAPDEAQVKRFVAAYPRLLAERVQSVALLDLRYTNGFAVRWREGEGREGRVVGRGQVSVLWGERFGEVQS